MDNFDKIIKQKVEQFDVPFNEAHWNEMNAKLNSIRSVKIKKNIFASAAVIAIVAISSYFAFFNNETAAIENNNIIADDNTADVVIDENNTNLTKENTVLNNDKLVNEAQVVEESSVKENETIEVKENKDEIIANEPPNKVKADNNATNNVVVKNDAPNANFIVYNNRPCLGGGVRFESLENDQPVSYLWNFGDGTISYKETPTHIYKESLTYTVTLTLLNRQTGKENTSKQHDVVTILPVPQIAFTYLEESKKYDDNALKYPYTQFNVKNPDKKSTYQWTFGNGENSTSPKAKTIYKNKGGFPVKLVVTNSLGCENSTKKKVTIKNGSTIYVQDAFKPNSNIAENETFIPKALQVWDVQFEMTIVNKAGKTVYQTSEKHEPWNGKMNNIGQVLDEGIYLWQVIVYDVEGTPHHQHGKINLVK